MGLLQRLNVRRRLPGLSAPTAIGIAALPSQAQITEIIVFDQYQDKIYYVWPQGEKAYVKTGTYPALGFNNRVKNVGGTPARFWCRITGDDGYTMTLTMSSDLQPGYTQTFGHAAPMPAKWAYGIRIETGVYGSDVVQDSKDVTIYNPDVSPPPEFPWWIFGLLAGGVVLAVVGKQQGWIT